MLAVLSPSISSKQYRFAMRNECDSAMSFKAIWGHNAKTTLMVTRGNHDLFLWRWKPSRFIPGSWKLRRKSWKCRGHFSLYLATSASDDNNETRWQNLISFSTRMILIDCWTKKRKIRFFWKRKPMALCFEPFCLTFSWIISFGWDLSFRLF